MGHAHDLLNGARIGRAAFHHTDGSGHGSGGRQLAYACQFPGDTDTLGERAACQKRADAFGQADLKRTWVFHKAKGTVDETTPQIFQTGHKVAVGFLVPLVLGLIILPIEFGTDRGHEPVTVISQRLGVLAHPVTEALCRLGSPDTGILIKSTADQGGSITETTDEALHSPGGYVPSNTASRSIVVVETGNFILSYGKTAHLLGNSRTVFLIKLPERDILKIVDNLVVGSKTVAPIHGDVHRQASSRIVHSTSEGSSVCLRRHDRLDRSGHWLDELVQVVLNTCHDYLDI